MIYDIKKGDIVWITRGGRKPSKMIFVEDKGVYAIVRPMNKKHTFTYSKKACYRSLHTALQAATELHYDLIDKLVQIRESDYES